MSNIKIFAMYNSQPNVHQYVDQYCCGSETLQLKSHEDSSYKVFELLLWYVTDMENKGIIGPTHRNLRHL